MANYEFVFSVEPMHCSGCKNTILSCLADFKFKNKQLSFDISLEDKTLTCFLEDDKEQESEDSLASQLQQSIANTIKRQVKLHHQNIDHASWATVSLLAGLFWLSLALGWLALPLLATQALIVMSCILLIYAAWPFVKSAWQAKTKLNMDSLFALTGLIVLASSIASLFYPIFPCLIGSGLMIFGFRHLGCMFQAYLDKKMGFNRSMVHQFRGKSYRSSNGETKQAHLFKVKDEMICQGGDIVPVDAKVVEFKPGTVFKDSLQTGQYFNGEQCKQGQVVLAGSEVESGSATLEVVNPLDQSRFATLDNTMKQLQSEKGKAPILKKTEQWLKWFIPVLLLLAAVTGIWVWQVFGLALAIQCVASILVSACPCTLGLIIPMALRMGAYKASLNGVDFKSSEALQLAADSSVFVLDYNGTLTEGRPQVTMIEDESEHLPFLKCLEDAMLAHQPNQLIGQAVRDFVNTKLQGKEIKDLECQDFSWYPGGAGAKILDSQWYFGNHDLLAHFNININEKLPFMHYLIKDNVIVSRFKILDPIKSDASSFVASLIKDNKRVEICTGADNTTTELIHQQLNLCSRHINTGISFSEKPEFIKKLRKQYPSQVIAMLGDGVNDMPALEASDLKIWVKNTRLSPEFQSEIQEIANIEIDGARLSDIHVAFAVAEQTLSLVYQNLTMSLVYNLIVLGVACGALLVFGISLPPALGVCLMIIQSALLALNTYRVLLQPISQNEECELQHDDRHVLHGIF